MAIASILGIPQLPAGLILVSSKDLLALPVPQEQLVLLALPDPLGLALLVKPALLALPALLPGLYMHNSDEDKRSWTLWCA